MFNILSYVGMNMQSEVCLWTLLGLVRTIFDATLFKVNANLKQLWQMTMPPELSMAVQRVLRTMISGIMLVQCFTVYVYLASYIVLLYPVFLEERPTLVLPWLLLAAIRKLLCELTSLTLGLGTCLLLGPARPPCIKFVMLKIVSLAPAFYMWMLVYSYYNILKVTSAFKTLRNGSISDDPDYGLELAVRRRRTKSLLDEDQLRNNLVASLHGERNLYIKEEFETNLSKMETANHMVYSTDTNNEEINTDTEIMNPLSVTSNKLLESGSREDGIVEGYDISMPRGTDRILEQFVLMMLRIGIHLKREGTVPLLCNIFSSHSAMNAAHRKYFPCIPSIQNDNFKPPVVAGSSTYPPTYLKQYPQTFMKNTSELQIPTLNHTTGRTDQHEDNIVDKTIKTRKYSMTVDSNGTKTLTIEKEIRKRIIPARKSSLDSNVDYCNKNEVKKGIQIENETVSHTNKTCKTVKQSSCSCADLHSKSPRSVGLIKQRIKNRVIDSSQEEKSE